MPSISLPKLFVAEGLCTDSAVHSARTLRTARQRLPKGNFRQIDASCPQTRRMMKVRAGCWSAVGHPHHDQCALAPKKVGRNLAMCKLQSRAQNREIVSQVLLDQNPTNEESTSARLLFRLAPSRRHQVCGPLFAACSNPPAV